MKAVYLLPFGLIASCAYLYPHTKEIHERKMVSLLEKFDRFDYNGNGKLTRAEVVQGLKELNATGVTDEEIDAVFKHCDTNRDGSVTLREAQRGEKRGLPEHGR